MLWTRLISSLFALLSLAVAMPAHAQYPFSGGSSPSGLNGQSSSRLFLSGSCHNCDMSHRNMSRISIKGSNFSGSDFTRSILSGGNLNRSDMTGAIFSRSFLIRTNGENVNFTNAVLSDATMIDAKLIKSDFSSAKLQRADLTNGEFAASDFSQTEFTNGQAVGADFTDAIFSLAKLHHTNFRNAIFASAQLQFTEFGTADVTGVDFTSANFSGADMRSVRGITQEQLDQGCGNSDTQLPSGFNIVLCPEYLKLASVDSNAPISVRTDKALDMAGKIAVTKSGIWENIRTLDRAIAALPANGSAAARAELEMSRAHLKRLYDGL